MLSNILQKIESIEKLEGLAQNGSSVKNWDTNIL